MGDDTLSTGEAAKLLGVTARRVHQMAASGELPGATQGANGRWRIPRSEVSRLLKRRLWERSRLARMAEETGSGMFTPVPDSGAADADLMRLTGRLEGKLEALQEYVEMLREELRRERERADRLQRELDRLRGGS